MGGLVLRKFIHPKHNTDEKRIGTDDVNDERMIFQLFLHSITHTHTSSLLLQTYYKTHHYSLIMSALAQTFTATSASALASRKSSSFNARSSLTTSSSSSSSSTRGARLQTFARVDGGVGVFGNKAGMTQIFTDDGLCVPVTVIAVKDGNYVSAVRLSFL